MNVAPQTPCTYGEARETLTEVASVRSVPALQAGVMASNGDHLVPAQSVGAAPEAVLDQYTDAPLAPRESPTPWRAVPSNVLGCTCLYDAGNGFLGTVVSPSIAARIVDAVNAQE